MKWEERSTITAIYDPIVQAGTAKHQGCRQGHSRNCCTWRPTSKNRDVELSAEILGKIILGEARTTT
jgi:hypothetical protein